MAGDFSYPAAETRQGGQQQRGPRARGGLQAGCAGAELSAAGLSPHSRPQRVDLPFGVELGRLCFLRGSLSWSSCRPREPQVTQTGRERNGRGGSRGDPPGITCGRGGSEACLMLPLRMGHSVSLSPAWGPCVATRKQRAQKGPARDVWLAGASCRDPGNSGLPHRAGARGGPCELQGGAQGR